MLLVRALVEYLTGWRDGVGPWEIWEAPEIQIRLNEKGNLGV